MFKKTMMVSAAVVALTAGTSALAENAKGTFIQIVPVTGSTSTNVFGITDNSHIITGSWMDASGVEHGYVGPLDGSNYTTFDDPNEPGPGTEPRAINDNLYITGFSNSQNGSTALLVPFERTPDGTITEVTDQSGALLNYNVQGLNRYNAFGGSYFDSSNAVVGYIGKNAQYKSTWSMGSLTNTGYAARGVNNSHVIVGWYYDASSVQHGLIVAGGVAQSYDPPVSNMSSNVLEGVNNRHMISGYYTDTSGILHGYLYNRKSGNYFPVNVPGSVSFVQAWGVNDENLLALGSDAGYYIFCPAHATCPAAPKHAPYKQLVKPRPALP